MIANHSNHSGSGGSNGTGISRSPQQILVARPLPKPSSESQAISPLAVLSSLRRSWKMALPLALCLSALGGYAGWMLLVPKYSASAFLEVDADVRPLIFETADNPARGSSYGLYQNTQKQLLVTPFVLNAALRDEEVAGLSVIQSKADPVAWLQEALKVEFPANGEIMQVSIETESPTACVKLVNSVVSAYMNEVVVADRNERLQRLDSLERVYSDAEAKVRNKRAELKTLASALRTGDSESLTVAQQTALQQYGLMQEKLSTLQFELMQAEGELQIAQQINSQQQEAAEQAPQQSDLQASNQSELQGDVTLLPPVPNAVQNADILRLKGQIAELSARLASSKKLYGSAHPGVAALSQELTVKEELLKSRIEGERERQQYEVERAHAAQQRQPIADTRRSKTVSFDVVGLTARVEVLRHHRETLQQKVDELDRETRQLGQSSIDIELMRSEITGLEEVLRRVGDEMERTSIELKPKSRIELISPAESATPPNKKKRYAATAAAGLAGLFAPFLLGVLWDLQRRNVNDAESASGELSLSTFGTIPRVGDPLNQREKRGRRYERQRLELRESIDAVAGMILHHARMRNQQVFMVSSALPGEGKSTVSCQLAKSLAQSGKNVALVDFDLRRPTIHRYMQLAETPGVSEVLNDALGLDAALQHTETPNLSVLVAGNDVGNLHERWTNSALEELFDELRASFDIVIVDACPVLPVVDARIVGTYCDGVILTLVRDTSRVPAAARACEMLKAYGVEVLGTVVIGVDPSSYYSSHGYYYQRSVGSSESQHSAKDVD
jgi:capsular exopolysaccharide synthesis family protein